MKTHFRNRPVRTNPQMEVATRGRQDTPVRSGLPTWQAGRNEVECQEPIWRVVGGVARGWCLARRATARTATPLQAGAATDACPHRGAFPRAWFTRTGRKLTMELTPNVHEKKEVSP